VGNNQSAGLSLPQWWRERQPKWPWILAALLLFLFVIAGAFGGENGAPENSPKEPTGFEATPALTLPDGLAGMDSASARDRLEELGFLVTIESLDGRSVIIESNWYVVSVTLQDVDVVVLRVDKPVETTTQPPVVADVPTAAATPPAEVAPTNAPAPAPEPTPYYANCDEARAAGAAPLYAGEPGYRVGLDRDRDGVACE